jgi:hypothetical protein
VVFVDADVQGFGTVHLETVVFRASAIDAVGNASRHANFRFVLLRLVAHTRCEGDKLREIAPIELDSGNFLARDSTADLAVLKM